jgi:hypothetical protein
VTAPADVGSALEAPDAAADLVDALGDLDDIDRDKRASITSDRTGKSFDYTYADLAAVLGHVRPILARHRLAVVQPVETTDQGFVAVSTVLVHTSGQRFPSPALRLRQPDDARTLGSTITYLRRYSVLAALGLATEDDDGAAASKSAKQPPARQRPAVSGPPVAVSSSPAAAPAATRPATRPAAPAKSTREKLNAAAHAMFNEQGYGGTGNRDRRLHYSSQIAGRTIASTNDLTDDELRGVLDALREGVQVPTPTEQFVDPADVDGRVAEWRVEWSERLEVAEGANDLAAITTLGNEAVAQHDQVLAEHARNAYDRVRHGVL